MFEFHNFFQNENWFNTSGIPLARSSASRLARVAASHSSKCAPRPEQHHIARHTGSVAQFRSDQNPAGAIQFHVLSVAQQQPLQRASRHGKSGDLLALLFPLGPRIHQQAAVRVTSQGQPAIGLRHERVTDAGSESRSVPWQSSVSALLPLKHHFYPT